MRITVLIILALLSFSAAADQDHGKVGANKSAEQQSLSSQSSARNNNADLYEDESVVTKSLEQRKKIFSEDEKSTAAVTHGSH